MDDYLLGATEPLTSLQTDRAWYPLVDLVESSVPLIVDPTLALGVELGSTIYLVGSGRRQSIVDEGRGGFAPVMQQCRITRVFEADAQRGRRRYGWPPAISSGNSGAVAFIERGGAVVPVGMLNSGPEVMSETGEAIDGLPYAERKNSAVLLGISHEYFAFVDAAGRTAIKLPGVSAIGKRPNARQLLLPRWHLVETTR